MSGEKMEAKLRCKKCLYKSVCQYKDYYNNIEHTGEKCKKFKGKDKRPCEVCAGKKFVYTETSTEGFVHYVFIEDTYFTYCPNCGRKL